ncbi:MAG: ankyrin repeat domain-containing protein [Proteobacteria bacterium]|nr:ankyrin repeat domain-containing protein [Pseudomonadota bacterium]
MARKTSSKSKAFAAVSKRSPEGRLIELISQSVNDNDDDDRYDDDDERDRFDDDDRYGYHSRSMKNHGRGTAKDRAAQLLQDVRKILKQKPNLNFQDDEKKLQCSQDNELNLQGKNWRNVQPPAGRRGVCGNTALMWACQGGHVKVATVLLAAGADPKVTNMLGENALHLLQNFRTDDLAAVDLAEQLVAAGADVNARNIWGATPLMMALQSDQEGYLSVAGKLLELGADPYIKTIGGHDAFSVAGELEIDPAFIKQMKEIYESRKNHHVRGAGFTTMGVSKNAAPPPAPEKEGVEETSQNDADATLQQLRLNRQAVKPGHNPLKPK